MNIYGQDELLKQLIFLVKNQTPFQLVGSQGIGKTTILKWIAENCHIRAVYVSCGETRSEWLKEIATRTGMEEKKPAEIQKALELGKVERFALFVDDLRQIKPQMIQLIKSLKNCYICYAGETDREEAKRILWGLKEIIIRRLDKKASEDLAVDALKDSDRKGLDINRIIQNSAGNPQMIISQINGVETDTMNKDKREEINILPFIIAVFVCSIIAMRYIGRAVNETDMYLIGGMGIGVALIIRLFGKY